MKEKHKEFTIEDFDRAFSKVNDSRPVIIWITPELDKALKKCLEEYLKEYNGII